MQDTHLLHVPIIEERMDRYQVNQELPSTLALPQAVRTKPFIRSHNGRGHPFIWQAVVRSDGSQECCRC